MIENFTLQIRIQRENNFWKKLGIFIPQKKLKNAVLLLQRQIFVAGTFRINLFVKPPLPSGGTSVEVISRDNQIIITKWYDNKKTCIELCWDWQHGLSKKIPQKNKNN